MELVHDFVVPVSPAQAWAVLTDVERIAPCLPGASVTSVDGDAFEGGMKIKVGPIGMTFKGHGSFVEKDEAARTAVIEAKGRDARGNGGAQAHVTAALTDAEGSTAVHVVTDLNVSGKAAQFGTGVMKDISNRLLDQFVANLAAQLSAESPAPAAAAPASATPAGRAPAPAADDGLDLGSLLLGSESTRRTAKTVATLIAGIAFGYLWGKNRVLERQARRG
jgi:carbon monoxide dehydrogenase subunit G